MLDAEQSDLAAGLKKGDRLRPTFDATAYKAVTIFSERSKDSWNRLQRSRERSLGILVTAEERQDAV